MRLVIIIALIISGCSYFPKRERDIQIWQKEKDIEIVKTANFGMSDEMMQKCLDTGGASPYLVGYVQDYLISALEEQKMYKGLWMEDEE